MKSLSISNQEKFDLVDSLTTFLSSGIPILESVESLKEESKGSSRKILETLLEDLKQGKTLAFSFARNPKAFDPITVNLIKAAEEAGNLEKTLANLTVSIQKDMDFLSKVKGSLVYPILVLLVLFAVIVLNLFFVIPRVSQVFNRLKIDVPLPTKILINISNFANDNLLLVIAGLVLIIVLTTVSVRSNTSLISRIIFSLPLISKLKMEIDLTRFTRSISLLLKSGVPIDESIRLSSAVVSKHEIKKALEETLTQVISGNTMSSGFKKHQKVIPPFMIRITEAGEKSGTLDKSMQNLSSQLENRVTNRLKTITILIEPFLLLVVGLLVGALMLAIIAPIYNLIGQIGQR